MFGISFAEVLVILIVALLVLGPKQLPDLAHKLGVFYAKSKHWLNKISEKAEEQLQLEELQIRIKQAAEHSDVSDLLKKPPEKSS